MPEEEKVYDSLVKYRGLFIFKELYRFCYDWLQDESNLIVIEKKYDEKISGNEKEIEVEWDGFRKITDYFRFHAKIKFRITNMVDVEVNKDGAKIKMNQGRLSIKIEGILQRDYEAKFEKDAFRKFLRGVYEKWVIPARVEEFRDKLMEDLDEFVAQTKAYLDLEGKSRSLSEFRQNRTA